MQRSWHNIHTFFAIPSMAIIVLNSIIAIVLTNLKSLFPNNMMIHQETMVQKV